MENLGQLFQHLATKAGIESTDPNLINVLSNAELSKITVHSDLIKSIDESLLSMDAALDNHPKVKARYGAEILNPVDKRITDMMTEAGFDEDTIKEITGIKSTYKRLESVFNKLNERVDTAVQAAKSEFEESGKASTDAQVLALKSKESELLTKLQDAEKTIKAKDVEKEQAIQEQVAAFNKYKIESAQQLHLSGVGQTIYDDLDGDTKILTLNSVLNKELQDKEAEFYMDDQKGFSIRKKDGTAFVGANHTQYTPQRFIEETLAQKKILKVSNTPLKKDGDDPTKQTVIDANDPPQGNNQNAKRTADINRRNREAATATT